MHGKATGDADGLAGDERRVVGQQEGNRAGIVGRKAKPPEWNRPREAFRDLAAAGGTFGELIEERRVGGPGAMTLRMIPFLAISRATVLVKAMMPPLQAE